jgi:hypothetical protein
LKRIRSFYVLLSKVFNPAQCDIGGPDCSKRARVDRLRVDFKK